MGIIDIGEKLMTESELMEKKKEEMEQMYGKAPKIDMSLIKNAEAANLSKEVKDKITTEKSDRKKKKAKFCFVEEEIVDIPTKGILYKDCGDEQIASGKITIKPMSLADEAILANQSYAKNGSTFAKLLDSCVVNDFDVRKLIPYDVFYLLYTLRKITYGEDYKFEVKCPECGRKFEKEVDITKVEWETLENEDLKPVNTIKLPVSKYTVSIEVPTLGNEESVMKLSRKFEDYDDVIKNYIVRTTEILDEDGDPISPDDYGDFFEALPGKDRAAISKVFDEIEKLPIPTVKITCPKCGDEREISIPFDKDFFRY